MSSEPPKMWACGHAPPVRLHDPQTLKEATAWAVPWGKRCPVCGLSYEEHHAPTRPKEPRP